MTDLAILDLLAEYPNADLDPHWVHTNRAQADNALDRIPPRYADATITVPAVEQWAREIIAWTVDDARAYLPKLVRGPSLLLVGPVGTGKTHQAYGAIRQIVHTGVSVSWVFTTAADMYADLRPKDRREGSTEAAFRRYAHTPLLVLDDVGAAKGSEFVEEITYRVINHRYEHKLATIVTSNLGTRELSAGVGERVASRLFEMSHRVALKGDDRRLQLRPGSSS